MRCSVSKIAFEHALLTAERFSGKNVTLPILGNVLLEVAGKMLKITATNLEYAVEISLSVTNTKEGRASVPAKVLSSLIQSIGEEKIDIEERQGNLFVRTDSRDTRVNGVDAGDFPLFPKIKKGALAVVESFRFKSALAKVLPAVSPSEFKPDLSGVSLRVSGKTAVFAGTDTFRLAEETAELSKKADAPFSLIMPQRIAQELTRVFEDGEVEIALGENQILCEAEGIRVVSRLIEGNFPEYSGIIPKTFITSCFLKKNEIADAIRASSIFSSKLQEVRLSFKEKELEVTAANNDVGEYKNKIPLACSGKECSVGFNYRYLLDGLHVLDEEEIFFGINTENSPSLLKNKSTDGFKYVVMPIRLT